MEPGEVEIQAKPQARRTEVENGAQQPRAKPVGVRTMAPLDGRRSPVEQEGWRVKV